jgi:hypothetical protein
MLKQNLPSNVVSVVLPLEMRPAASRVALIFRLTVEALGGIARCGLTHWRMRHDRRNRQRKQTVRPVGGRRRCYP